MNASTVEDIKAALARSIDQYGYEAQHGFESERGMNAAHAAALQAVLGMFERGPAGWLVEHRADKQPYQEAIAAGGVYGASSEARAEYLAQQYGGSCDVLYAFARSTSCSPSKMEQVPKGIAAQRQVDVRAARPEDVGLDPSLMRTSIEAAYAQLEEHDLCMLTCEMERAEAAQGSKCGDTAPGKETHHE